MKLENAGQRDITWYNLHSNGRRVGWWGWLGWGGGAAAEDQDSLFKEL